MVSVCCRNVLRSCASSSQREPEVTVNKRAELHNPLVIASKGLREVISNEVACSVLRRCLEGRIRWSSEKERSSSGAADAAVILIELRMARDSQDNISVIMVVEFKKLSGSNS
ncbi:hypothetical protein CRG98_034293 [Punica granatum]|uniref:PPM-type phosphatase domain-containing protein n=1 Tax=Punica granatum TaxID=22663 RepID=A0A2I0IMV6_PUNGR|nr:hypothetical protein CRG98_034293 [Punica granatum]